MTYGFAEARHRVCHDHVIFNVVSYDRAALDAMIAPVRRLLAIVVAVSATQSPMAAAQRDLDAFVEPILAAWDSADVVCLGERHGSRNDSELRIALVRHPDFTRRVDVVVVEFASPVKQDLLDRFVLNGEELSREELQPIWRETGARAWESPIYEEFLRAVRDVNLLLPAERRVRVLAGDSPIDWSQVETAEDLFPHFERGGRGGEMRLIVAEQVLAQNLKALAVFGAGHCEKRGGGFPGELEPQFPGRFWVAYPLDRDPEYMAEARRAFGLGDEARWIPVTGTPLANRRAAGLFYTGQFDDTTTTLGRLLDAIIYYGSGPDDVVRPDTVVVSPAFQAELRRRSRLTREAFERWMQRER